MPTPTTTQTLIDEQIVDPQTSAYHLSKATFSNIGESNNRGGLPGLSQANMSDLSSTLTEIHSALSTISATLGDNGTPSTGFVRQTCHDMPNEKAGHVSKTGDDYHEWSSTIKPKSPEPSKAPDQSADQEFRNQRVRTWASMDDLMLELEKLFSSEAEDVVKRYDPQWEDNVSARHETREYQDAWNAKPNLQQVNNGVEPVLAEESHNAEPSTARQDLLDASEEWLDPWLVWQQKAEEHRMDQRVEVKNGNFEGEISMMIPQDTAEILPQEEDLSPNSDVPSLATDDAFITQHKIFGSTLVTYGAGLEIRGIIYGLSSCFLIIRNLYPGIEEKDVTELLTQQGISSHRIRVSSITPLGEGGGLEAKVIMNIDEGLATAVGLYGKVFKHTRLRVGVSEMNEPARTAMTKLSFQSRPAFEGPHLRSAKDRLSHFVFKRLNAALSLYRPILYESVIPVEQFISQRRQWVALFGRSHKNYESWTRIDIPPNKGSVTVLLGGSKAGVGVLKVSAEVLLAGEKLDASYWCESFLSHEGQQFLSRVYSETGVYVRAGSEDKALRIFGEVGAKDKARAMIRDECSRLLLQQEQRLTLTEDSAWYLERAGPIGTEKLMEIFGGKVVALDLTSTPRTMTVRGGQDALHCLDILVSQADKCQEETRKMSNNICPVCHEDLSLPVVLACGHAYCTACLRHLLISTANARNFPVVCVGDDNGCLIPLSISTIQRFLTSQQWEELMQVAFLVYLEQHPQEFGYCPTPDCPQIFSAKSKTILKCPSCFSNVCTVCTQPHINGQTCDDIRATVVRGQERMNDRWASKNGVKHCPKCKVYIEKTNGCNHVTCRCGAHMCWLCGREFRVNRVYAHISKCRGPRQGVANDDENEDEALVDDRQQREADHLLALALDRELNANANANNARRRVGHRRQDCVIM